MNRVALSITIAMLIGSAGRVAHAQESVDRAVLRRDLISRARTAANAGDFTLALDLATRAAAIEMTPSLRLFIAEQEVRTGRWTDATTHAVECAREAAAIERITNRAAIVTACNELVATARAHLAWIRVRLHGPRDGTEVRVNGRAIGSGLLDAPVPIGPGPFVLELWRGGERIAHTESAATAGATVEVVLAMTSASHSPAVTRSPRRVTVGVGPIVVGSLGIASTVASGIFFALRQVAQGPCVPEGPDLVCPTQADAHRAEAAITYNLVADVTLGVGLAALGASVVWWAIDRRAHERFAPHAMVAPSSDGLRASIGWWF